MGQEVSSPNFAVDDNTLTNIDDITKVFEDSSTGLSTDLSLTMSTTAASSSPSSELDGGGEGDASLSNQVPLAAGSRFSSSMIFFVDVYYIVDD